MYGLMCRPPGRDMGPPLSAPHHQPSLGKSPGRIVARSGGRQMSPSRWYSIPPHGPVAFSHQPVLRDQVVACLAAVPKGWVADCTLGGAGHAAALLEAAPHLSVLGIDQDSSARAAATERLAPFGDRARIVAARFDELADVCTEVGIERLCGALFDLGVSSPQLDRPERGFSHRADGPLDMRMNQESALTADEIVNRWSETDLARALHEGGEERFARKVARAIVSSRPVPGTARLAELVRDAIPAPARRRGGDPANRAFQALRIAVNAELDILPRAIKAALDLVIVGGRVVVESYHSGEDRIVKAAFAAACSTPHLPPGLPVLADARPQPVFRIVRHLPRTASDAEVAANRRSASVRLRAVERLTNEEPPR